MLKGTGLVLRLILFFIFFNPCEEMQVGPTAVHQMERLKSLSKDVLQLAPDRDGGRKQRARKQTI